jgi:hypothetical protein
MVPQRKMSEENKMKLRLRNIGNKYGLGHKHTEEYKRMMSKMATGRHVSIETRMKLSKSLKGKPSYWKGKKMSEESKQKMSKAKRGKYLGKNSWHYGKPKSEEHKRKLSAIMTGRKLTEEHKNKISKAIGGENHYLWGKKRSKKIREIISSTHADFSGNNNPAWLGGRSFEPYGVEFNNKLKESIRKRDNHQCQECHQTEKELGYRLYVHHIDYDKKNNKPVNLISLCCSCHAQTGFNRNDWSNYFKNKINNQELT